jgi:HSP20 family protein
MMNGISRWEPFRGVTSLQEEVNRLFENTLRGSRSEGSLTIWAPAVDIHEAEDALVVKADLPGMKESDLDVRVENNTLTIRGERKFESEVKEENYLRVERSYGGFTRSFSLPNTIKSEGISATYENGVLAVKLPKREETKPRQVKVNVQPNGK